MTATLKMTHKAIGVEVRRGTYDIVVDGQRAGLEVDVTPARSEQLALAHAGAHGE